MARIIIPETVGKIAARYALLTREQEVALAERIRRGDRAALHEMVTANLQLVVKVARQYAGLGLPLADLIKFSRLMLITMNHSALFISASPSRNSA